ncbi:MAG: GntR family transcriptional regulator [Clostridium sp.]|nr:GntR family transcriptional regulator [Clostridium sp.]
MNAETTGIKRKTLGDSLYERLLDDIVCLRFAPGEKISEAIIVERYGVSRAPVRDALGKLERKGLVRIKPQFGTVVSEISSQKVHDICDVRLLIECHAVKIAAPKMDDLTIAELQEAFDVFDRMDHGTEEFRQQVSRVDVLLHGAINAVCGNVIIPEIIEQYQPEIQRIRRYNRTWANRAEASLAEMKCIFKALKQRDPDAASRAMEDHIKNIKKATMVASPNLTVHSL